ncbi:hypothetical protein ROS60_003367 [Pluralibacter gergoviae]|uniref:hypothetical protein n=1 Tax=Pluralibacter gergoviae TaxID=61647 RepID=UPI0006510D44|nr:hypothetical protein [Pluralibacter gergoviae]ELG9930769.1 hypothetical protein [Pluralibacter gergoviae]ELK5594389.1 hypothetical protein [Pluralibacter gergoviae]KMK18526.1 hypothetical protein ABW09_08055 [Pluralibacter gergoviae]MDU4433043.1 hypothetical protein [Pluralibacter gergoviae]
MTIHETDLANAGFTARDVDNLKRRLTQAGGTMEEIVAALARRFKVSAWITAAIILIMLVTFLTGNQTHKVSGSISSFIVLVIAWATFPPALGWKALRLQKTISRQDR